MKVYFLSVFLMLLFLVRFSFFLHGQQPYTDGEVISFTTRLTAEPVQKGRDQTFSLRPEGREAIYIRMPLFPEYHYGEMLSVSGTVELSEGEKMTFATMRYPVIRVRENDSLLYGLIAFIRENVSQMYNRALPQTSASLLMGIVFGIKSGLPETFKDALQRVGVFHVVAASGMNVTLIAGAFMATFSHVMRRQGTLILSIFGIFFYALLAGFEPSIVRASIMGAIVFFSGIMGRQNFSVWTLVLTGYTMILWDPRLVSDIGFQLSFLATLGILFIPPVMSLSKNARDAGDENMVSTDLKTTIAAQVATLPILLSAFGEVSLLSVIANLFILWMIPFLMVVGSVSAIVGMVMQPVGVLIVYLSLPFLLYFEWVVLFFSRFDWVLRVEQFPWQATVGYYVLLFSIVGWKSKRRGGAEK